MKVLALDGNSLAYRAYYGLARQELTTSSGAPTGALHGFMSMLISMLRDQKPDLVVTAFDLPDPTFRHVIVTDYKGGRQPTPEDLIVQIGQIQEVLGLLNIPVLKVPGYEADDIVATIARSNKLLGGSTIIVTGDRDCFQLVEDPWTKVMYTLKGVSQVELYDEEGIANRTGVLPIDYPLYAALRGDKSDNLPGIQGIGEKTAAILVNSYKTIDEIYDHLDELKPKVRESLIANKDLLVSSMEVVPLVSDVPLEIDIEHLRFGNFQKREVEKWFKKYELHNTWTRFSKVLNEFVIAEPDDEQSDDQEIAHLEVDIELLDSKDASACFKALKGQDGDIVMSAIWDGQPGRGVLKLLYVGYQTKISDQKIQVKGEIFNSEQISSTIFGSEVSEILSCKSVIGYSQKELWRSLWALGVEPGTTKFDCQVASYLLNPTEGKSTLKQLAEIYRIDGTRYRQGQLPQVIQGQMELGAEANPNDALLENIRHIILLYHTLIPDIEKKSMSILLNEIEMPLVDLLAKMEIVGIGVSKSSLEEFGSEIEKDVDSLSTEIQAMAGRKFNVNSTKQLSEILYDEIGLQAGKKTKTGRSTDARSLQKLVGFHPIIEVILKYRELEKLRSTYGKPLLATVEPDGRIHASFTQTVARTGRLSSENPNLHNIPIRTDIGKKLREVFMAKEGSLLVSADYNQIELRLIAHLSKDPGLIYAFSNGLDVHRQVASGIYGIEPSEVTSFERSRAKMVAYGLSYGMEAYGLSERLGTSVSEAKEILERFFEAFKGVATYTQSCIDSARELGYAETMFKRRRPLPDLRASEWVRRNAAERQAMNAVVQGSAADIFKLALLSVGRKLKQEELDAAIVLQVHDEIIVEAHESIAEQVKALLEEGMANVVELDIPLLVEVGIGKSWGLAKEKAS
ncbi:MAG: DNA polymerase I [Acidimicrobiales bacterium]|nr:DNA polymerase I [Acidimicrobiales bacterium]